LKKQKIALDEEKIPEKVMDSFGVSVTSVKRYLQELLCDKEYKDTLKDLLFPLLLFTRIDKMVCG